MRTPVRTLAVAIALLSVVGVTARAHAARVSFITVDTGVKLEVVDWGGSNRSVLLLAGNGQTAHSFDEFASRLADRIETSRSRRRFDLSRSEHGRVRRRNAR